MKNIIIIIIMAALNCVTTSLSAQCEGNEFCTLVNEFNDGCDKVTDFLGGFNIPTGRGGVEFCNITSVGNWAARSMCDPDFCGAIDPNIKYGPGNNDDLVHTALKTLHYSIQFENLSTATANAAEVWVYDTLEPNKFELSSFRFGEIHLGETTLPPFEGNPHGNFSIIDLRSTLGIDLKIEVSFDPATGIAQWHFLSLDPDTYQKVLDPDLGFLPPNVDGTEGTAGVTYFVKRLELNSGDSIRNTASIVFDANPSFTTDEWLVVIDITRPESHVHSLPPASPSSFLVEWSGQDAHAGILYYNVYVSVNDGPFTSWIRHTTDLSATYQGAAGNKYEFYSIAMDRAENREYGPAEAATSPDAMTVVNPCLDEINDCDLDLDGISSADGDCDDSNPAVNPLAPEVCNGIDDNCNGLIDDADPAIQGQLVWYIDTDNDGFGDSELTQLACIQPEGFAGTGTDCDDDNDDVFPGANELNDGLDNDCDGTVDEGYSTLSADAGDCDRVYRGYGPAGCTMLTVVVQGGVSPYTFAWSNGTTTESTIVCPEETTIYTVVVSDQNGNTTQDAVTVQVVDIRCGNNNNKVSICHIPPENPANAHTLCISESAVAEHLDEHGDYLGVCNAEDPCGGPSQSLAHMPEMIYPLDDNFKLEELLKDNHDVTGLANEIEVFPNPTDGTVYLRIPSNVNGEARLIVQDLSGHVLAGKIISDSQIIIDLSSFSSGLYVLNVISANGIWQKKIMKSH